MAETGVSRRMSGDWNRRAKSDALYYVALGRKSQSWEDFFRGAEDLVRGLEKELGRISTATPVGERRALEIGCGPGRLMLPLSAHFHEIHGVDVSERMVRLAERNLAGVPNAHAHATSGTMWSDSKIGRLTSCIRLPSSSTSRAGRSYLTI